MIIDCVSDLHGHLPELEGGDLLIVAGDLTASDQHTQYLDFFEWLVNQKYTKKVIIGGNHDTFLSDMHTLAVEEELGIQEDCDYEYLCDSGTEFEGLKIWGSPWTCWFYGVNPRCTAFMRSEGELEGKWAKIPDDTDILVTHSPPFAILDQDRMGVNLGDMFLKERIDQMSIKLHVFGHIHAGHGRAKVNDTVFVNAAITNDKYKPVNEPMRVIL